MKDTGARLTRDTVLRAALDLLDEVGIDALSTRRLAERLGVQSPTLYWHFRNKGELLEAMSDAIMLERRQASLPR
ncbi:TetR family transcriptional regulator, partial [Paraburkholderia sp. Se-20369]|nr:TetR family transcriptional regulator [Paraburkholderia sp. Se-20369]